MTIEQEVYHSIQETKIMYPDVDNEKLIKIASKMSGIPEQVYQQIQQGKLADGKG